MRLALLIGAIATMLASCGGKTNGGTDAEGANPPFDATSSSTGGASDGGITSRAIPDASASGAGGPPDAPSDAAIVPEGPVCAPSREDSGCWMGACTTDADCGHEFLVCVPKEVYVDGRPETRDLCEVRYQLPCEVDADCGNGFTCNPEGGGICYEGPPQTCVTYGLCESEYTLCESAAECPASWECYSPRPPAPKACYPPFALFF
jgi:hypothetical protein